LSEIAPATRYFGPATVIAQGDEFTGLPPDGVKATVTDTSPALTLNFVPETFIVLPDWLLNVALSAPPENVQEYEPPLGGDAVKVIVVG
jgi:hypothetical protein